MSIKTIVAVYGTLLSKQPNHHLLERTPEDVRYLGKATSKCFGTMYSNGGFPILSFYEPDSKVEVELYEVGEKTLTDLDRLEGYPGWYDRSIRKFLTKEGGEEVSAYIYHQDKIFDNLTVVPNGDWAAFVRKCI